jgi:hypothetical protein
MDWPTGQLTMYCNLTSTSTLVQLLDRAAAMEERLGYWKRLLDWIMDYRLLE